MRSLPLAAVLVCCTGLSPSAADDSLEESVAARAEAVLRNHCYRCHGQDGAVEGGLNFILDRDRLVAGELVSPGDVERSLLLARVAEGEMPPEGESPRPSDEEVAVLRAWIAAGAPAFNPAAQPRTFVSPDDIARLVREDLDARGERNRPFARYLTITHLYNAGRSDDELQTYRHALSKLVNSLSWGRRVVVPAAVDPARTVFRIDMRDYEWSEKIWERIVASYPYGVTLLSEDFQRAVEETRTVLPYVRGDWFVAAAARPPLYHQILELPETDAELESRLGIGVVENIRQDRVARAGFNGSGVSRNNRLIERHESPHGAYWKSYDFAGNANLQNLFAHPLGPFNGGFQHDGGEIIFNLPNGLQAYLLVDAAGQRIDKGPTAIVSDPRQPDRAVVNGLSCMSCHVRGTISKRDQIRQHVERRPESFSTEEVASILAIYPPDDSFETLLREDAKRFARAVEATGGKVGGAEPIVALAQRFEAELDLPLAAAEAGLTEEYFREALDYTPRLSRPLGSLAIPGGTVQRDAFIAVFGDIVLELKLGAYLPPVGLVATSPEANPEQPATAYEGDSEPALDAEALKALELKLKELSPDEGK